MAKKAKVSVPKGCIKAFTIFNAKGEMELTKDHTGDWWEGKLLSVKKMVSADRPVAVVPLDGRFEIVPVKTKGANRGKAK
jgi:hypothetical protein